MNLTFPAHCSFVGDPLALYAGCAKFQVGHGGYGALLSFSPELFWRQPKMVYLGNSASRLHPAAITFSRNTKSPAKFTKHAK